MYIVFRYTLEDKEIDIVKTNEELVLLLGSGVVEDFIPGLKYVYKSKTLRRIEQLTDDVIEKFFRKKFHEAKRSFCKGTGNQILIIHCLEYKCLIYVVIVTHMKHLLRV